MLEYEYKWPGAVWLVRREAPPMTEFPLLLAAFTSAYCPGIVLKTDISRSRPMTTHQRNFPSIDPAKLERLAQTAVKVGLRLQPGQDLFLTAPVAALPLARRIVAEAYKAGAGLVTPILSDEEMHAGALSLRPGRKLRPRARLALRWRRQGVRRQYGAARHRRRGPDAARA